MFYYVRNPPVLTCFSSRKQPIPRERGGSRIGGEGGKHGLEDLSPYWDFPLETSAYRRSFSLTTQSAFGPPASIEQASTQLRRAAARNPRRAARRPARARSRLRPYGGTRRGRSRSSRRRPRPHGHRAAIRRPGEARRSRPLS